MYAEKEYKQAIVVRTDLKMGKGKLAAQAAHASVGALKKTDKKVIAKWEGGGGKKVVLKVGSLRKLKALYDKAAKERLPCFLVSDAGLTQLRPGVVTALGIGPAECERVDKITRKLKLL